MKLLIYYRIVIRSLQLKLQIFVADCDFLQGRRFHRKSILDFHHRIAKVFFLDTDVRKVATIIQSLLGTPLLVHQKIHQASSA